MATEITGGPSFTMGPLLGTIGTTTYPQEYDVQFGPSMSYQGDAVPDVRFSCPGAISDMGIMPGFLNNPYFCLVDTAPAASAATPVNIAAAQTITNATAMTLVSSNSSGITCNMPFNNIVTGSAVNSTSICLDFGFDTLNVTSGSATATPSNITRYYPAMWIVIAISATVVQFTQVASVGTTTITLRDTANGSNASAPVGTANFWGLQALPNGIGNFMPTAHTPYRAAGAVRLLDPLQSITRGVGIAASATASCNGTTNSITIVGADLYGQTQSEVIVPVANTTVYGNKAYKWITSATPNFTDLTAGHTYSIGTSDLFGMNIRSDKWEFTNLFWNGAFQTAQSNTSGLWTAANTTSPNPTSPGADAKGTFQVSSRGPQSSVTSNAFADGTKRLAIFQSQPLYNLTTANSQNAVPFFGVVPA